MYDVCMYVYMYGCWLFVKIIRQSLYFLLSRRALGLPFLTLNVWRTWHTRIIEFWKKNKKWTTTKTQHDFSSLSISRLDKINFSKHFHLRCTQDVLFFFTFCFITQSIMFKLNCAHIFLFCPRSLSLSPTILSLTLLT